MSDEPIIHPQDDPLNKRRALVNDADKRSVTYVHKSLPPERLEALRQFLKSAKSDEIAAIRSLYGDIPDVLRLIGLEVYNGERGQEQTKES